MQAADFQDTQADGPAPALPPMVELLIALFRAAPGAADPMPVLPSHRPAPPRGRAVVVGICKAAAAMEPAAEAHSPGPLHGAVVPEGSTLATVRVLVLQASHPVPDDLSVTAAHAHPAVRGAPGARARESVRADDTCLAGTDGMDGCAGAAGAWQTRATPGQPRALGLHPLLVTGPTRTTVDDFRAIVAEAA